MIHRIPAEFTEAEKIFGGRLTLKQAFFTAAGAFLGFLCLALPVWLPARIFLLCLFAGIGFSLAFVRVKDTELLLFIVRYISYRNRTKDILLIRRDVYGSQNGTSSLSQRTP